MNIIGSLKQRESKGYEIELLCKKSKSTFQKKRI